MCFQHQLIGEEKKNPAVMEGLKREKTCKYASLHHVRFALELRIASSLGSTGMQSFVRIYFWKGDRLSILNSGLFSLALSRPIKEKLQPN